MKFAKATAGLSNLHKLKRVVVMIRKIFTLSVLVLIGMLSVNAMAAQKTAKAVNIAENAEKVSPLLNGQTIPDTIVYDTEDKAHKLHDIIGKKPTVMIFYRGGWCPYCSAQLASLKSIEDRIIQMGYQLIAISPDSPQRLSKQTFDADFKVQIYSDKYFEITQEFGLGFYLEDKVAMKYRNKLGTEFVDLDGTSRVALPVPAIYILDTKGLVHFQYVNPNYSVRLDNQLLFQAAKVLDLAR